MKVLKKAFEKARKNDASVHFIGLVSDGDVHSSMDTLFALLRMAKNQGCEERTYIHAILDGQDVLERTADVYIEAVQIKLADIGCGQLATLCGRHYAMNRGQNLERIARAYTMLVHSEGERAYDAVSAIHGSFLRGNADYSVQPIILEENPGVPVASVKDGDVLIFFNHRADRMRQLVKSLTMSNPCSNTEVRKPKIEAVCMTEYDPKLELPVAFKTSEEKNVLGKVFADNGVANCRLTETEKYVHVTYFFNGGIEIEHPGEKRVIIASPKISSYENQPEMGSFKITDVLLRGLEESENDVFIVNLPAADIIAHTGNVKKTIEAIQYIDICLGEIVQKIREVDGVALITSDHGNCEEMSWETSGKPKTSHTCNPVPFHLVANNIKGVKLRDNGALADVAPTILSILGIDKPNEMTGRDLRETGIFY